MRLLHRRFGLIFYLLFVFLSFTFQSSSAECGFSNFNTILVGEMAAGMAGAFTSLTGDPSACAYYNPATLARMEGASLSASANLYNNINVQFGDTNNFIAATAQMNQGGFQSIPAASGSISAFGVFAFGLSIVMPDYDFYSGSTQNTSTIHTYKTLNDSSLWIGGTLSLNLSETQSLGMTQYYTSRTFNEAIADNLQKPGNFTQLTSLQKNFSTNSIVTILGYYWAPTTNWAFGMDYRPPSVPVAGAGNIITTTLDTQTSTTATQNSELNVHSETRIPSKISFGASYREPKKRTFSFDVSYYFPESFLDMQSNSPAAERVDSEATWNFAIGTEFFLRHWLRLRTGIFTNKSASAPITNSTIKHTDHIDMYGISANFAIFTSDKVSVTVGGYYTGGSGNSVEFVGGQLMTVPKSNRIYSLLVASSYFF